MTREIKFRAWNIKEKKMVSVSSLHLPRPVIQENNVVMQFSGLKDKNGVEIYEGDIVKLDSSDFTGDRTSISIYKIEVEKSSFVAYISPEDYIWVDDYHEEMEAIGNIYENPELIEEAKKE